MADASTLCAQAIEDRIRDNIADFAPIGLDDVAWQGIEYQPGEDDWMRPVTLFAETQWHTHGVTGTGENLISGVLTCSFFTPPGYGMSALDDYAGSLRALFDRVDISISGHGDLQFGPAGGPRPGPPEDSWLSVIVDCPFTCEENG